MRSPTIGKIKRPAAKPGRCVYCGGLGMSKEHLFGDWLNKLRPHVRRTNERHAVRSIGGSVVREPSTRWVNGGVFSTHVWKVCITCNTTWLSQVQGAAKPVLRQLLDDEALRLTRDEIDAVLSWVVNAVNLGELTDLPTAAIQKADFEHYCADGHQPPAEWRIYMGRFSGKQWADRYFHCGMEIVPAGETGPGAPNSQITVFTVGAVVFFVASAWEPSLLRTPDPEFSRLRLVQLWPNPPDSVQWPSTFLVGDPELNSIRSGLLNAR